MLSKKGIRHPQGELLLDSDNVNSNKRPLESKYLPPARLRES
jgi:hypothetical protein